MMRSIKRLFYYAWNFGPAEAFFRVLSKLGLVKDYRSVDIFCTNLQIDTAKRLQKRITNHLFPIREVSRDEFVRLPAAQGLPPA